MASGRLDLYAVLGVPRSASTDELTVAYRRRARLTHPDAGGDALAFRSVSKAFDILKDPGLRAAYDAELHDESSPGPTPPNRPQAAQEESRRSGPPGPSAAPSGGDARRSSTGRTSRPTPVEPAAGPESGVDLGQIRWAEPFLGLESPDLHRDRVRVVPGRSRVVARVLLLAVTIGWCAAGVWVGGHRLPGDGDSPVWAAWVLGWWLTALVVGVQVLRRRVSLLLVLAGGLAWPAFTAPRLAWSWAVYGWLAGAVALPVLLSSSGRRPVWPLRRVWAGNVFGEPSWAGRATEPIVCDVLVIPAARLLHQVAGAEHAVVVDRKVALVGGFSSMVSVSGCQIRVWPSQIVDDPARAVEEIGRWLLDGTDGWTIDRAALAAVQP